MRIIGVSGSLRTDSYNTALLRAAAEMAGQRASFEIVTPGGLPLYDADLEGEALAPVFRLSEHVAQADGVLIATPEYNHGVPGGLKNLLDWLSRQPFGRPFIGKPVAIMSASTGVVGGARSQAQLKLVLLGLGAHLFFHNEVLVGQAANRFESGRLTDETTRKHVLSLVSGFLDHLEAREGIPGA